MKMVFQRFIKNLKKIVQLNGILINTLPYVSYPYMIYACMNEIYFATVAERNI